MFVYFVKSKAHPQMLKIGKAKDVAARIAQLQTGCPYELKLVGSLRCKSEMHAAGIEQLAHRVFKHARRRGEWFEYSRQMQAAVATVLASPVENLKESAWQAFDDYRTHTRARKRERTDESAGQRALDAMDREFRGIVQ
jgi:predicted GIY-YIG superfamily endonuclease